MTNENETVADIVASMRGDPSEQLSSWEDTINTRRIVRQFLVNYADRIEAAHKREIDACCGRNLFQLDKDGMVHPVFESAEIERLRGALLTICTAHGNLRDIAIAACNGQDYEAVARAAKEKEANNANA